MKKIVLSVMLSSCLFSGLEAKEIEFSGNFSITSNYIWRGMEQSNEKVSLQGGIDLDYKGFYVGSWGSNLDEGTEIDFYGGYSNSLAGIDYDLGYIKYLYSADSTLNFEEIYIGLSKSFLNDKLTIGANYFHGLEEAKDYVEGISTYGFDLFDLNMVYGSYSSIGKNYTVSIGKEIKEGVDISLGYSKFDYKEGDTKDSGFVSLNFSF